MKLLLNSFTLDGNLREKILLETKLWRWVDVQGEHGISVETEIDGVPTEKF